MELFLQPPRLTDGMRVAVIAPASPVLDRTAFESGIGVLEQLGLQVVYGSSVFEVNGYLAGTDEQRAADLAWALCAPDIDAIWCARGGFGSHRTVAALHGRLQGQSPLHAKAFIGFSDLTVIHQYIARTFRWVTFYGPTVDDLENATEYTLEMLRRALFSTSTFTIANPPDVPRPTALVPGIAEAALTGGCLELLAMLVGSALSPLFEGKVVFFEDVAVSAPRVDRRLAQLMAAGCFAGAAGILIGEHAKSANSAAEAAQLSAVFREHFQPLGIPCLYGVPLGHGMHQATLPLGTLCRLDSVGGVLEVVRPGVR